MIAHLLRFQVGDDASPVETGARGLFLSFAALTFIENSIAGNDRNLDIPALLTYNLFVFLCLDGGRGKEAQSHGICC